MNGLMLRQFTYFFQVGSECTGKSHLVKVIYNTILKAMLCHCKDPEKPQVLLLGSTKILALNIGGTTIYSGLRIKPRIKLLGLNNKSKVAFRNRLSNANENIDEFSTISSDSWTDVDSRLVEIFMMIPEKTFAGLLVMIVVDLLQLPPDIGELNILTIFW